MLKISLTIDRGKELEFKAEEFEDAKANHNYIVYYKTEDSTNGLQNIRFQVDTFLGSCTCLKPISHGYPCKHLLTVIRYILLFYIL